MKKKVSSEGKKDLEDRKRRRKGSSGTKEDLEDRKRRRKEE